MLLKCFSTQMLIVHSNRIYVKRLYVKTSHVESKDGTSSTNENDSFMVYSFDVRGVNVGIRNLARLSDGVFIAKRMGRREGHQSMTGLCTLARPYSIPE